MVIKPFLTMYFKPRKYKREKEHETTKPCVKNLERKKVIKWCLKELLSQFTTHMTKRMYMSGPFISWFLLVRLSVYHAIVLTCNIVIFLLRFDLSNVVERN